MEGLESLNVKDQLNLELFVVEKGGSLGIADKYGRLVQDYDYDEISAFNSDGFASVKRNNRFGAIDKYGKLVFPCIIDEVICKVDHFAVVKAANKHMVLDTKTYSKRCEYDEISFMQSPYMQNLALVRNGASYGVLDVLNNTELIPSIYSKIEKFEDVNYFVYKDSLKGILGKNGEAILECEYLEINEDDFDFTLLVQNENEKWGVVNKTTGKVLVPCEYDKIETMDTVVNVELRKIEKEGKIGIYNTSKQEEIIPCIYDSLTQDFELGLIYVEKDGKHGVLNEKGEVVLDCVADTKAERINEHFLKAGNVYLSLVTRQVFTKEQYEMINKINSGKMDYKNLPKELISSARCLKELIELSRHDLKKKENLEEKDADTFIEFAMSLLEQKKQYEMSLCSENSTGLNVTEIQEFADLCKRNIETVSVNMVSIHELTFEYDPQKDKEGKDNG